MVSTRSKQTVSEDDNSNERKLSTILANRLVKTFQKRKDDEEEEQEDEDDCEIFESDIEDEFEIPSTVEKDAVLKKKFKRVLQQLESKEPLMETILNLRCKMKDKLHVFELYYIYKSCAYNSEERLQVKTELNERITALQKETRYFRSKKEEIQHLEKKVEDMDELMNLKKRILHLTCDEEDRILLYKKYKDLENCEYHDEDYYKQKTWLINALKLPFNNFMELKSDDITLRLKEIKCFLDKELYGMTNVKEQILLFLNDRFHNPVMKGCSLGLVGCPGVGKTTVALCLSRILGLPFQHIALGGLMHADSMKGHESTYIGSKPGVIAQALMRMQFKNGILFFDEFDKVNNNEEIVNVMLHLTDFSQNHKFQDNYFTDLELDLSSCWFIYSMNAKPHNKALADRVFYINVKGYNISEKVQIIQNYILPKQLQNAKLKNGDVVINEKIAEEIIRKVQCNDDKGIRMLDTAVQLLVSKIMFFVKNQDQLSVTFSLPESYFPFELPIHVDQKMLSLFMTGFEREKSFDHLYI